MFEQIEWEEEQELGPGTDLVLSLLSVVITILAVVSAGYTSQPLEDRTETLQCEAVDCSVSPAPAEERDSFNNIQQGDVLELHGEILTVFARNKARLASQDMPLLKQALVPLYHSVRNNRANSIRIHGHASPEPRAVDGNLQLDGNMDLSVERSLTILHAMHQLGVPYRCMVVEGYGRNQSFLLNDYLEKNNMTVEDWDKLHQQGYSDRLSKTQYQAIRQKLDTFYQRDRRVILVTTVEQGGLCSNDELGELLRRAVMPSINAE